MAVTTDEKAVDPSTQMALAIILALKVEAQENEPS